MAAGRLRHVPVHPDFMQAVSARAKPRQHPTFAVTQEARDRFLPRRKGFTKLLTCYGYLTISDR